MWRIRSIETDTTSATEGITLREKKKKRDGEETEITFIRC
jgi:hypothetical protein